MKMKLKIILNLYRIIILYIIFFSTKNRNLIVEDLDRWKTVTSNNFSTKYALVYFMLNYSEYRSVFLYRIRYNYPVFRLLKILFPPERNLRIDTQDIGGGLFIQHGFSTIICARSIGKNCWINQQVTIGYKGDKSPVIGNNVTINCGAIVIGDISIGDNVVIGAGSVVVKNVGNNTIVAGNPAHVIKKVDNNK